MGKVWKRRWLREHSAAAQRAKAEVVSAVEIVQEDQPIVEPKKVHVPVADKMVEKKAPSVKKAPKVKKAFKPKKK